MRVARGIAKNETLASIIVFRTLKRRGHPHAPPPIISDGWGGIGEAMLEVYGRVPPYTGRGRPPTRKRPGPDWKCPFSQRPPQDAHTAFTFCSQKRSYSSRSGAIGERYPWSHAMGGLEWTTGEARQRSSW